MPAISPNPLMKQDLAAPSAKRIGIVIEHLGSGGAEKAVVVLANGLAERGYCIDLLMWRASGFHLKNVSGQVTKIDLSAGRPPNSLRVMLSLMHYLREKQPAVVFPHLEKSGLLTMTGGLLTGYRGIVPCIQIDLIAYANSHHRMRRWLLNCLVIVLYRLAPQVIAVSEGAGRTARRLLSPFGPPVQVIYNGLDLPALLSKAQQPVEETWLRNKTIPLVIACGRLTHQKAHDTLLRAFAILRRTLPARLVILGEGEEHDALLSLVLKLGVAADVSLPGVVDDPIAWFAKSDLFVLSSRCEGQSLVLIEALIAGVPIVSTDCPSGPREVLANGRFGTLVPMDDVAAFAKAMSLALEKAPKIDKAALTKHLEKFGAGQMLDGYLAAGNVDGQESPKADA